MLKWDSQRLSISMRDVSWVDLGLGFRGRGECLKGVGAWGASAVN